MKTDYKSSNLILPAGYVLDGRYRIEGIIYTNDYSICYKGINLNSGNDAVIYEYFHAEYMSRDISESDNISLFHESDIHKIELEKEALLKEARVIRDYGDEDGFLNVTDCFSVNNTVYIVFKYTVGVSLSQYVTEHGKLDAETAFRKMVPVIRSLGKIHESGIMHRDINPDNIWVTEDGCFKIFNIGAARDYSLEEQTHTVAIQSEYSPSEFYDHDMRQGPWTDTYSICATLYFCITGTQPSNALDRIFNDTLRLPSESDISIKPNAEKILLKGLSLDINDRYVDFSCLLTDINHAYPEKENESRRNIRPVLIISGIILLILFFVIIKKNEVKILFPGQKTITFYLMPQEGMTDEEFTACSEIVRERFRAFAGSDRFLWKRTSNTIAVTSSIDIYGNQDIDYVVHHYFAAPWSLSTLIKSNENYYPIYIQSPLFMNPEICHGRILEYDYLNSKERMNASIPEDGEYYYLKVNVDTSENNYLPIVQNLTANRIKSFTKDKYYMRYSGYYEDDFQFYSLFSNDLNTCYIRLKDDDERLYAVAANALTHSSLSYNQILNVSIDFPIDWEKKDGNGLFNGMNQVNANELQDDTTVVLYRIPQYQGLRYITIGNTYLTPLKSDLIGFSMSFKSFFDILDVPYAFGTAFDGAYVAIKIKSDNLNHYILDLSTTDNIYFGNPVGSDYISEIFISDLYSTDQGEYYIKFNDSDVVKVKECLRQNTDLCYVYFYDNDRKTVIAKCDSGLSGNCLRIKEFTIENSIINDKNCELLFDLLKYISNEKQTGRSYYTLVDRYSKLDNKAIPAIAP